MRTSCVAPALAAFVLVGCRPSLRSDILISDVNLIDVTAGRVIARQDVLVQGTMITHILSHGSEPVHAAIVVDGHDRYLIPGLWDMHAHIRTYDAADVLPMFIVYGITGIRDLGLTKFGSIQQWRREIDNRTLVGPRIISSGVIIEGAEPRFPSSLSISSSKEIAPKLDPVVAQGVDLIKLFQNVPGPVFSEIVAYARNKGLPTAGHIPDEWNQIQAAETGLGSIEHFWGLEKTLSYREGRLDQGEVDRLADVLKANNTFECPTLINGEFLLFTEGMAQHPELELRRFRTNPMLAYSPAYFRAWWEGLRSAQTAALKSHDYKEMRAQAAFGRAAVRQLSDRGVKFLAGTDTPNPYLPTGASLQDELVRFADAGMEPAEVLRTATLHPAEFFGRTTDLGIIAAGHLADLVVLERNPLEKIKNTTSVYAVIANGRFFSPQDLVELKRTQLDRLSAYRTTDLDQVVYMEVRRAGISGARVKFPDPLHNHAIIAKPEHLVRLSATLMRAGETDEARKALKWNLELFPGNAVTRIQLDSLPGMQARRVSTTTR
jgi:imidazolonepropionase-like amidohydrolase